MNVAKPRVAVVYDGFPHYRKGVIEALAASKRYEYLFLGDIAYRDASINPYQFPSGIRFISTRSTSWGPLYVQRGIWRPLRRNRVRHVIFLGNPWFLSYWLLTPLLRLQGKKVFFWTHGWISEREPRLRAFVKEVFFRLPYALLLYGGRAKGLGLARGFKSKRLHVIGNSLDYSAQKLQFDALATTPRLTLRNELGLPRDHKVIICTARLTKKCRFDLLIEAARQLTAEGQSIFVLLVGIGPERDRLASLAQSYGVVHRFWGACYEEATIARLYKAADLTVSPGKVGLTAMHSMAYGTPVISHGNFNNQMPEFEAIVPGVTGEFFTENSSEALAEAIKTWFMHHPEKPERACIERVEAGFTPESQRLRIEAALQGEAPTV